MPRISEAIREALATGIYKYNYATPGQHGELEIEEMVLTRKNAIKILDNEFDRSFKGMMIEYGESNE